jgi:hypothetical protein
VVGGADLEHGSQGGVDGGRPGPGEQGGLDVAYTAFVEKWADGKLVPTDDDGEVVGEG